MTHQTTEITSIYIAEEQEFYRHIYQAIFATDESFKFVGIGNTLDRESLMPVLVSEKPKVLIIGIKKFNENLAQVLERICLEHPRTGLMILLTHIDEVEAKLLRRMLGKCKGGVAMYLKQSLDNFKQLQDIAHSVNRKQIVLDPAVANTILMEKTEYPFMNHLTEREMEILNLLSQGCTNLAIAKELCIDIKTVAHHLNNIYSKLKNDTESELIHPRVSVARIYLETTGELMPSGNKSQVLVSAAA